MGMEFAIFGIDFVPSSEVGSSHVIIPNDRHCFTCVFHTHIPLFEETHGWQQHQLHWHSTMHIISSKSGKNFPVSKVSA